MSLRRLEVLQWLGLLLGAALWGSAHIVGYGTTEAACNTAGTTVWGIDFHLWEGLINGLAAAFSLASIGAAIAVVVLTRDVSYEDSPPVGRMRFFAIAAIVANVLFITMDLLYTAGSVGNTPCVQA